MNTMKFDFSSPSEFSDWAGYAGFNRKTGEIEPARFVEPVKPPQNMGEVFEQKTANVRKTFAGIPPAMAQMSQGNVVQGVNALRGFPVQQNAPVMPDLHDYTKGIED